MLGMLGMLFGRPFFFVVVIFAILFLFGSFFLVRVFSFFRFGRLVVGWSVGG